MRRNHALDFLKVIATALIIMHHYQQGIYVSGQGLFYGGPVYFGRMVELFFLISGYLMYKYQNQNFNGYSFKLFYLKKALRLLPLTAISAVVYEIGGILYRNAVGSAEWGTLNLSGTLFNALGIQAGWASVNPCINNPTWYISVLLLCYLIFYGINRISAKYDIMNTNFYIGMIFVGVGIISYDINLPFLNNDAARGYYSFFFGILLANFLKEHQKNIGKYSCIGFVAVLITAFGVYYYQKQNIPFDDYYWLTFVFFPTLIVFAETSTAKKYSRGMGGLY